MIGCRRVLLVFLALRSVRAKTNCSEARADYCSSRLVPFSNDDALVPVNTEEMEEYCRQQKETEACAAEYSDFCLDSLVRQLSDLFVQSAVKQNKERCEARENFLKRTECAKVIFQPMNDCMKEFIVRLEMGSVADIDLLVPTMCCAFGGYQKCASHVITTSCNSDDAEYFSSAISRYSLDLLDYFCEKYTPGSSKCDEISAREGNITSPSYLSIFPPLVHAMDRLINEDTET
ncbi:uncharacterized protein LOC143233543 [Tachypleus tridentatus]|uniref:uncharacterized protein LOC143233543 n=1 Tax=Tachypleus tridentatus TaxID=6853 RepID=UPI003FCF0BB8